MQRVGLLAWVVLAGCGARTGLDQSPSTRDGGLDSGVDAGMQPPIPREPEPVPICPVEPCDCEPRGRVTWEDVALCASSSMSIFGCQGWADRVEMEVPCAGLYTVCARVESLEGCVIGEACGSRNTAGGTVSVRVSGYTRTDVECERRAATMFGAHICVRVGWRGAGRSERELGCFARAGPWCFGPRCGPGRPGGSGGEDGEWEF